VSKGQKETATQKRNSRLKRTAEQKVEIYRRITEGETLRSICRCSNMPQWRTVYDWLGDDKEFAARFGRARELGEIAISQECLEIADDAKNDYMESQTGDGAEAYRLNGEHIQRSKLRIETRLKLLAKWSPKKWGDNSQIRLTDNDGNPLSKAIAAAAGNLSLNPPDSGE